MSIIYIIGVNAHEYMRKEMMGKWIALLTCIINLKGNNTSATHKNIIPPYVSFHIVLENMLLEDLPQHTMFDILIKDYFTLICYIPLINT